MRRMLYIPLVSQQSLDGNVGFQEFHAFSDYLRQRDEGVFWYVVMPSWVTDGLRGHDRMQYIPIDNVRDHRVNDVVGFSAFELAQYFARRGGRFIIDGVLSNCVQFSAYASHLLSDPARKQSVPVFVRDHGGDNSLMATDRSDQWFLSATNYIGCHTALRSDSERSVLSRIITGKTNGAMSREFKNRSFLWPVGYDLDELDEVVNFGAAAKGSDESKVLFCGGDFDLAKNKRRELDIARKLSVIVPLRVSVTSWSPQYKIDRTLPRGDSSFIWDMNTGVSRSFYRRGLASTHLFVSVSGEFNILAGEEEIGRLLYGQVGVFPHMEWTINRLGSDYPFYYNEGNDEEAILLAEWIVQNYAEAVRRIEPMVERLRENQSLERSVDMAWSSMVDFMDMQYRITEAGEPDKYNRLPLFPTIYKVAMGLGDQFDLDVFLDVLEEHLPWLKAYGRKGSLKVLGDVPMAFPTLYDIREMLNNLGWVDMCSGPGIVVRRERPPLAGVHVERLEKGNG